MMADRYRSANDFWGVAILVAWMAYCAAPDLHKLRVRGSIRY